MMKNMQSKLWSKILAGMLAGSLLLVGCTTTGDDSTPTPPAQGDDSSTQTAEGDTETDRGDGQKILRVVNASEPGNLHPAMATGTHDSFPINHMFEGLYQKNPDGGEPVFSVAQSAETSEDGLVWTFKLNPDAKWSNGDQVTAHDFVANLHYCIDPVNAAQYSSQLFILKNGEAVNKGELPIEELGVKALDDETLEYTLNDPLTYLPDLLTHYTFLPIHKANAEAHPDWSVTPENYVSNGAFVLSEWKNKESLTMTKNPHFMNADQVKLDGITFTILDDPATTWQMFQAGELDAVYPLPASVIEQMRDEGNPALQTFGDLSTEYYLFNTTKAPFNNAKVRRALTVTIDRQTLVDNVAKGGETPAYSLTCPGISDGTGDFQQNLGPLFEEMSDEDAKALLEEGLAEEGMALDNFSFKLLYNTNDIHKKNAEAIQAMWIQKLGVQAELENAEFQVVLDRRKNQDFDVVRAGWVGDYADPMTFMELQASWNEFNHGKWISPEYDALITTAMTSTDNAARMEAFREAERMVAEEMPIATLYFKTHNWAIRENVSGYYKPINRFVFFQYADIA